MGRVYGVRGESSQLVSSDPEGVGGNEGRATRGSSNGTERTRKKKRIEAALSLVRGNPRSGAIP